jgi:predicted alpha/beta superfamily hydrolase
MQHQSPAGAGAIDQYDQFESRYVVPRRIDVWLPPGYEQTDRHFPVLYMHDGQNIFVPELAYTGIDWGVDEGVVRLIGAGAIGGAIVVGIWNTPLRVREYMPQKPVEADPAQLNRFVEMVGGPPLADDYLRFMVEELKPFVDARYRTMPEREHTSVMGSSMGALISLYALCEHLAVFGAAGCVSTHWTIGGAPLVDYFGGVVPRAGAHRIYFDYGTEDTDAPYEPMQLRMDALMERAGYLHGADWVTHKFAGAGHSEQYWRARVDVPLRFLLA